MTPSLWTIRLLTALVVLFLPGVTTAVTAINRDTAQLTCLNLLTNSTMESNTGWVFGPSPSPGGYSLDRFVSPVRSARLGITTGPNVNSFSSMRQTVIVPAVDQLRLQLQVYPISQPPDPSDEQEIRILDPVTNATLRQVWSAADNDATWKALQFDLSAFLGRTIVLYIHHVRNNGSGGVTAMYVDDVVLEACSAAAATPTPTVATPTPTPPVVTATPHTHAPHRHRHAHAHRRHQHAHADPSRRHGHPHTHAPHRHRHAHAHRRYQHAHADPSRRHGHPHTHAPHRHRHAHAHRRYQHAHADPSRRHGHPHTHAPHRHRHAHAGTIPHVHPGAAAAG